MSRKPRFLSKVLGGSLSSTTPNIDSPDGNLESLRPSASQSAKYSGGEHITCLDNSSDGHRVVVAGQKIFKVLRVDGPKITEDIDLRAAITSYAQTHDPSAATPDQLNIRALKWSHSSLDGTIVTASGNGKITVYDLNRGGDGYEVGRITDHARQVHKLQINPFKENWLLSASQDGTVRFFDIRATKPDHAQNAKYVFRCQDAVRDVKWSTSQGYEFACCTDNGTVQKWDMRKTSAPLFKLTAHSSSCRSISWHYDGVHLASGGADQICNVWDMSNEGPRHRKPKYSFITPAPIIRVTWRPPCWSATAHAKRAAQLTVAYDETGSGKYQSAPVHIWDLARSTMPFKEIEQWESAPTAMIWNTQDLLWCVDKEGNFTQTDVAFVPKLIDRRSLSQFTFSPTGDVLMLLEERQSPRRSRPTITPPDPSPSVRHQPQLLSVSRSDSEEDVVGSFLGPRQRKAHRRRNSGRTGHTVSTTPPTGPNPSDKIMHLDDAVQITGYYKPQQVMAMGHAPATAKRDSFKYFSNNYMLPMGKALNTDDEPLDVRMSRLTEYFAKCAEEVGSYRLAQTWRLLGYTTLLLLSRRAEYHRQSRLTFSEPSKPPTIVEQKVDDTTHSVVQSELDAETPRKFHSSRHSNDSPLHRSTMALIVEDVESTSNVATPIVRPVRDNAVQEVHKTLHTSMGPIADELTLPDATHPKAPSPIPVPGAKQSPELSSVELPDSSVEGYDFYGMEAFSPSRTNAASSRKQPLRLDYKEQNGQSTRIQPQRHDSNESFQMFSTSGESRDKFMSSDGSEGPSFHGEGSHSLRSRVHKWESCQTPEQKHRPSIDSTVPAQSLSSGGYSQASGNTDNAVENGLPFRPSSPPVFVIQEASGPSATPARRIRFPPSVRAISPRTIDQVAEAPSQDPNVISSDFYPWPNDPPFVISPIDPATLVTRTIDFEIQTSPLHASVMIILLLPMFSHPSIKPPLKELQAIAILQQYHRRLTTQKLFVEACMLRNLCVPTYPDIFALAQEDVKIGFYCTICGKALENDPLQKGSEWRCPRCTGAIAPCPICQMRDIDQRDPLFEDLDDVEVELGAKPKVRMNTWFLCPGCNHGGHTSCLSLWHSGTESFEGDKFSGGCCPVEGCLHPCLPGQWRDEFEEEKNVRREKEMHAQIRERQRGMSDRFVAGGGVKRDMREVGQSRAVEGVRAVLNVDGGRGGGVGVERLKSVRMVDPRESMSR